ncbi:DUF6221 family protein [Nocardia sp. MH4]|uniref:DUF6221 family protein n=1 Tax=Nocardia sp. MH4 TaxID=1768677 RepID=UPI001C4FBA19|nr:DUF6221 family protein [Nocardia sp. MH4]
MTIEEFIEARLTEDERDAERAQAAASRPGSGGVLWVVTGTDNAVGVFHDPARVLRQVAATRELFERAKPWPKCRGHPGPWMPHGDYGPGFCGTPEEADSLRVIAAIWSDHPDYRPEWATA